MRKLLLALALLCFTSGFAEAQNTQCSNRSVGDSTNACANTRFVQAQIAATPIAGFITCPANQFVNTIAAASVCAQPAFSNLSGQATLAQLPTLGANTVLGSIAGGTPIALTTTQHTTLVNVFTSGLSGAVPASGGGTSNFLRADGTFAAPSGTSNLTITPQVRITLATGTPVMQSSQASKTTVFVTPYVGNLIPIYDGTNMVPTAFAEVSQATTDTTKSPAAVAASSNYDIFCYTVPSQSCSRGPAWTNLTTRSAGTALVMVNGILLNNASITNGPAAQRGTYVGTISSDASSQINYVFGASASGGTAANFGVWNAYNRVSTGTTVIDSGTTYTYAVATTRQARASAGNQVSFVIGLQEDTVLMTYSVSYTLNAANCVVQTGVGFDVTNAFSIPAFQTQQAAANGFAGTSSGIWDTPIGFHFIAANENVPTANTVTFNNASGTLMVRIRN